MDPWEQGLVDALKLLAVSCPELDTVVMSLGVEISEEPDRPVAYYNGRIVLNRAKLWKITPLHLITGAERSSIERISPDLSPAARRDLYQHLAENCSLFRRIELRDLLTRRGRGLFHFNITLPILFIIIHELWHLALDHVRRFRRVGGDPLFNLVADCLVNSLSLELSTSLILSAGLDRAYLHAVKIVHDHVYNLLHLLEHVQRLDSAGTCEEVCRIFYIDRRLVERWMEKNIDDMVREIWEKARSLPAEEEIYLRIRRIILDRCGRPLEPHNDLLELPCSEPSRQTLGIVYHELLRRCGESGHLRTLWWRYRELLDLDWTIELRRLIETCSSLPYGSSYAKHSIVRGLPGDVRTSIRVIVLLDVSDSMEDREIERFLTWCREIMRAYPYNIDLRIVAWSDKIVGTYSIDEVDRIRRGGGTRICPALEHAAERADPYTVIMVYTDSEIGDVDRCRQLLEELSSKAGQTIWITVYRMPPREVLDSGWEWLIAT